MARYLRADQVRALQLTALANGGSVRPFANGPRSRTVEWDISGRCSRPVKVELHGRAEKRREKWVTTTATDNRPNFVEMDVRCRRCPECLRMRAAIWSLRARTEFREANRTWLCTFTLNPTAYMKLLSEARYSAHRAAVDYESLSEDERFMRVDRLMFGHVQLWMKRLRKSTDKAIRYLSVTEAHKSGVPHVHMLVHEPGPPVLYAELRAAEWPLGFSQYKLVKDGRAAGYVCKYLSKELRARVRASQRYGE